jgi:hypothetical protein
MLSILSNKLRGDERKMIKNDETRQKMEDLQTRKRIDEYKYFRHVKNNSQNDIKDHSGSIYAYSNSIKYHTPLDMNTDAHIDKDLSDNEFVFFKDSFITPLMINNHQ